MASAILPEQLDRDFRSKVFVVGPITTGGTCLVCTFIAVHYPGSGWVTMRLSTAMRKVIVE